MTPVAPLCHWREPIRAHSAVWRLHSANYSLCIVAGVLYGATLAGDVPLSALMPSLVPHHRGAAMSMLNLGAGASTWVGPAIVGICLGPLGVGGVMW